MKVLCSIFLLVAAGPLLALDVPVKISKLDSRIELAAKESHVFRTYLKDDDIKIESKDGVVTLTGSVTENSHKSLAGDTVANLPAVKNVENKLEVTGAPTANSDAWLSDKLKITLMFYRSERVGKAEVDVKDGIVTLRGVADNQAQKESTGECALDVDGVKEVNNEMTVSTIAVISPRTMREEIDDASIATLVRMALLVRRSTSGLPISIVVRRGVVTVDGRAKDAVVKDKVSKVIQGVTGVKRVKNRMSIDPL
jgi:osmotically-inducible protein OsmY